MIVGCGIDIVKTDRFSKFVNNSKFMERFFHQTEIEYVLKQGVNAAQALAVRFAVKEALGKALGTGIGCLTLKNICVANDIKGKPHLYTYGDVNEKLIDNGVTCTHISLSHEKEYVVAQVILENAGGRNEQV